jgi:hypothetical protein
MAAPEKFYPAVGKDDAKDMQFDEENIDRDRKEGKHDEQVKVTPPPS